MSASVNKAILIGNLGADPDIRSMQSGAEVCNLSIATSESWKDKDSGERKERTEWHRVVVFNEGIINVCKSYLKKGAKVFIEGQIETRSYEKDGTKFYTTEIVLRPFRSTLTMLDGKRDDDRTDCYERSNAKPAKAQPQHYDELEDEIPF